MSRFQSPYQIEDLRRLMENLRDPQYGCNWDKKQSLKSLIAYTLEEAYEVVDAIESGDFDEIQDELGDLLFQIVFYAQIAQEQGQFDFNGVVSAIVQKLLRRHPHVYPDGSFESFGRAPNGGLTPEEVEQRWEQIKNAERAGKKQAAKSLLDDVPVSLPAMDRAKKLQKRASSAGFDWETTAPVLAKLKEEVAELEAEIAGGDKALMSAELGDVLFSCVNLARHLGVEPEAALRQTNAKFERRFRTIEQLAEGHKRNISDLSLEEMDRFWDEAKQREQLD
ncbi:MAG: nucleoside triphosphate pyrophosphohydrolase [Pseudohongiellaceae bacterium]|nr:nucleoside triphosphate pyrophosphohydrolase [Pseudohongiellaceae bacterium]